MNRLYFSKTLIGRPSANIDDAAESIDEHFSNFAAAGSSGGLVVVSASTTMEKEEDTGLGERYVFYLTVIFYFDD